MSFSATSTPKFLLLRAAPNPFSAQPVFVLAIAPAHVQDLALGLGGLDEVCTVPPHLIQLALSNPFPVTGRTDRKTSCALEPLSTGLSSSGYPESGGAVAVRAPPDRIALSQNDPANRA